MKKALSKLLVVFVFALFLMTSGMFLVSCKKPAPEYCKVTFSANGGEGEMESIKCKKGEMLTLPENEFEANVVQQENGFRFAGWSTREMDGSVDYKNQSRVRVTKNLNLYAVWSNVYYVTLDVNGGRVLNRNALTLSVAFGGNVTLPAKEALEAAVATNDYHYLNYGFVEESNKDWNETTHFEYGDTISDVRQDKTVYVYWDSTYQLNYLNEVQVAPGVSYFDTKTQFVKYADGVTVTIKTPAELGISVSQGEHLAGWEYVENGQTRLYQPEDVLNSQRLLGLIAVAPANRTILTLTATWQTSTYRLVYDTNNGRDETFVADESYEYNSAVSVPSEENFADMNFTEMEGYTLRGWSTSKIALATNIYSPGNEYSFTPTIASGEDLVLYAIWEDDNQAEITVSYNSNGGEGEIANQLSYVGGEIVIANCTFTKENCQCIGWAFAPDGEVVFEGGETILIPYTTQNITLYAVWVELGV